jgi:hypothetical protein
MWSGPAAGGRLFLWAPNEVEDVGSGNASRWSARGLARSTADLTNATSLDGESVLDAREVFGDNGESGAEALQTYRSTSSQPSGTAHNSPVRIPPSHTSNFRLILCVHVRHACLCADELATFTSSCL